MYIYINKDNSGFSKVFNYFYFKTINKLNGTVYYGERSFGYNGKLYFVAIFEGLEVIKAIITEDGLAILKSTGLAYTILKEIK